MQFVVDESTGVAVVEYLRDAGHDVVAVSEVMPQSDDRDIMTEAAAAARILITNDKDFGELAFRSGQTFHGVLFLRLHDESPTNRVRVVRTVMENYQNRLSGNFIVASEGGIRVRPTLSLVKSRQTG
jgi:predicted nuclease of predicted toxin-antitoxin system